MGLLMVIFAWNLHNFERQNKLKRKWSGMPQRFPAIQKAWSFLSF
jgi:hypothetical protein